MACKREGVQKIVSFAGARPNPEEEPARLTHFSEQSRKRSTMHPPKAFDLQQAHSTSKQNQMNTNH